MKYPDQIDLLSREIIYKSLDFGASLAGIANIEDLKLSPSHVIADKLPLFGGVGTKEVEEKKHGQVRWVDSAYSAVVIALEHPKERPELDWWVKGLQGGTIGNLKLISILSKLGNWLEKEKGIQSIKPAYHIEHGAVYMKDAAVLAGLGCIGKNNMLVTPQFGSRVRLRVMMIDVNIPSIGKIDFDPCSGCKEYCTKVCPQLAFDKQIYSPEEFGQNELPGRTGFYNRIQCNIQMENDILNGTESVVNIDGSSITGKEVRYCRLCEFACIC